MPSISLDDFEVDPEVIKLIPEDVAIKHTIIPVNRAGATLIVTADCGTVALEPIARAQAAGLDVVVTDHHTVGPDPSPATHCTVSSV